MAPTQKIVLMIGTALAAYAQPQSLDASLRSYTDSAKIPGIVAVVCSRDAVVAIGAAGLRRAGAADPITVQDRSHIGSNSKAMLATVAAMLVEEGKLTWEAKPTEILEIPLAKDTRTARITLMHLLNHHAGLAPFDDDGEAGWRAWTRERPSTGSEAGRVRQFARWILQRPPAGTPGDKFLYSNAGYVVAAAMVERVTGMPWKDVLRKRLFEPLKMSADFGWPAADNPDQPFGHLEGKKGWEVQDPKDPMPPFIEPAGGVKISAPEYVKFLQFHLQGLDGSSGPLLSASAFKQVHTPVDKYGLGWKLTDIDGAPASFHTGSTDSFYAIATLVPSRNLAIAVLINAGGERAQTVAVTATKQLFARFQGK